MPGKPKLYEFLVVISISFLLFIVLIALLTNCWDRKAYPRLFGWQFEADGSETATTTPPYSYSYPRLVPWEILPWELERERLETDTTITVRALSHACNLDPLGDSEVTETFDHVKISETADTVTIETWLGPPQGPGFSPYCLGQGHEFFVEVRLDTPLGNRLLIDPACALDRYAHLLACPQKDPPVSTTWIRPGY